jgi:tetraacyldisaccharide 4'-kinase
LQHLAHTLQAAWLRRGPLALALWPLSCLMGLVVACRRQAYNLRLLRRTRLPVPVVVVGNRIVGGAGKTPVTLAVLQWLSQNGWQPGVLSRGYGASRPRADGQPLLVNADTAPQLSAADTGDEPWLIWRRTGKPMAIGADRAAGGRALLAQHPDINILVCDDGLQHLALERDVEIIVFDERGAGNGWLLPAGPLREPLNTRPPHGLWAPPLVLYNAASPSTALPGHVGSRQLAAPISLSDWWGRSTSPGTSLPASISSDLPSPAQSHADTCWAMAGIAHPQRFFDGLRQQGWCLTPLPLTDHAPLDGELPWPEQVRHLFITEKDAVKLDPARCQAERPLTHIWVVGLDFQPEPSFWQALNCALARQR